MYLNICLVAILNIFWTGLLFTIHYQPEIEKYLVTQKKQLVKHIYLACIQFIHNYMQNL